MKKTAVGQLVYSPTDLVRYLGSPFASWMDRYYLENPEAVTPDEETDDEQLIAQTGQDHEQAILAELKAAPAGVVEIRTTNAATAREETLAAITSKSPVIYQAALHSGQFVGYADFLMLDDHGCYQVWDTKLARSPKPYYAVQLCCYADMLTEMIGDQVSDRFGIILGTKERVQFRLEDFVHYYRHVKTSFLTMQERFTGRLTDRPEPLPRADHREWTSHAEQFFKERDHLVQVAGVTVGQIKKLNKAGITTMAELAQADGRTIPRLSADTLEKLVGQARLQCATRADRVTNADAPPRYEVLPHVGINGERIGLAALPPADPADVFFDMEGYPLAPGGLEYLFGVCQWSSQARSYQFQDWWAHDRDEEKRAFEGFVDWVFGQWKSHPGMHIYHYADYEVSAIRRLSTRHDTRQDEVDELLRNEVFVDLYRIVRQGLRIGEDSYSIKVVERLYRPKRATEVTTAADSIVQYSRWMESTQPKDWNKSPILKAIRQYNEDDCQSTAQLSQWLRKLARENNIQTMPADAEPESKERKELLPEVIARQETARRLRERADAQAIVLADVIEFHRREQKPIWWRMFDRAAATPEEQRDDPGCIEGIEAAGPPASVKQSLVQVYRFDPAQECKLAAGERSYVMFAHALKAKLNLSSLDASIGTLELKIGKKGLSEKFGGAFPKNGSLISDEYVPTTEIQAALDDVAAAHLSGGLHRPVKALLTRQPPVEQLQLAHESSVDAAIRVAGAMSGGCLVIQGPPGTGKTHTASRVIAALLASKRKIGIASNSHKAIVNLLTACGKALHKSGSSLCGIKVGGEMDAGLHAGNNSLHYVEGNGDARGRYVEGVVGGTAWLFSRPEWEGTLDYLFIDEAGQVSLANAIAMARCAKNLVLLGDQMQSEQPIQGSHPGDAGLSVLRYALKDTQGSVPDLPVFHPVVPPDYGLFLGESRRMHPAVCRFISESIYESRLFSHPDCTRQRIELAAGGNRLINQENGILFSPVEHDGNTQQSDEEVERVKAIYNELVGRPFTTKDGTTKALNLEDFLFIAPYNAQVRVLKTVLPQGARAGSVDKFQGQEAPVCILSLCSSYGEYGSRGLAFILDRNRINVAISRAQCLAVVVADPRIARSIPSSLGEMALLNLFCKVAVH
ncbi:TM0106 family RecB-like putative nuclease [Candidatus Nitrospira bockiana]